MTEIKLLKFLTDHEDADMNLRYRPDDLNSVLQAFTRQ